MMKRISRLKVLKLFSILFILALLFYGCGSDSDDDGPSPLNPGSNTDIGTDSDSYTETETETDTDPGTGPTPIPTNPPTTPTPTGADFSGTHMLYNEFLGCLYQYLNFEVTIAQSGNGASLTIIEQDLSCQVVANELICNGAINSNGQRFDFQNFTLRHTTNGGLEGESDYSHTDQTGDTCDGEVTMTTIRPDTGSVVINNPTPVTFRAFLVSQCGANQYESIELRTPFSPNTLKYFTVNPGCFDLAVCQNVANGEATGCVPFENVQVTAAETSVRTIPSLSAMGHADPDTVDFENYSDSEVEDFFEVEESSDGDINIADPITLP